MSMRLEVGGRQIFRSFNKTATRFISRPNLILRDIGSISDGIGVRLDLGICSICNACEFMRSPCDQSRYPTMDWTRSDEVPRVKVNFSISISCFNCEKKRFVEEKSQLCLSLGLLQSGPPSKWPSSLGNIAWYCRDKSAHKPSKHSTLQRSSNSGEKKSKQLANGRNSCHIVYSIYFGESSHRIQPALAG